MMTKTSMGEFLAALRRANGMTQQEVADLLNVSNKAVSRWERNECAPDLTLIPALAELFGVTCDELLRGERCSPVTSRTGTDEQNQNNGHNRDHSHAKAEQQVKALIRRAVSNFQTLIWISLALSAAGFIGMFGISYGFYRPDLGFAVMLLLETAAFTLAAIACGRMKALKTDNEFLEAYFEDQKTSEAFHRPLGRFSFAAFFAVLSVILLSLPLILTKPYSGNLYSVMELDWYLLGFFPIVALCLGLIFLIARKPFVAWITGVKQPVSATVQRPRKLILMNLLQLGATLLAALLFVLATFSDADPGQTSVLAIVLYAAGGGLLLFNLGCGVVILCKSPKDRNQLLLSGIRNILLSLSALLCNGIHSWYYVLSSGESSVQIDYWDLKYLCFAIGWAILMFALFEGIRILLRRKKKDF